MGSSKCPDCGLGGFPDDEWDKCPGCQEIAAERSDGRFMRKLKRKVTSKIWECIQRELSEHWCCAFEIVGIESVKGERLTPNDWFGCSSPIRKVYSDVSSCSYSDSYGGMAYYWIGKGRYLKMQVSG